MLIRDEEQMYDNSWGTVISKLERGLTVSAVCAQAA